MNHFHIWCDIKPEANAREFGDQAREFLSFLYEHELIEGFNIARRQFAIDPPGLGEFHITVEFGSVEQMNRAFEQIGMRTGETDAFHKPVADSVRNMTVALYRDWPEPVQRKKTEGLQV